MPSSRPDFHNGVVELFWTALEQSVYDGSIQLQRVISKLASSSTRMGDLLLIQLLDGVCSYVQDRWLNRASIKFNGAASDGVKLQWVDFENDTNSASKLDRKLVRYILACKSGCSSSPQHVCIATDKGDAQGLSMQQSFATVDGLGMVLAPQVPAC